MTDFPQKRQAIAGLLLFGQPGRAFGNITVARGRKLCYDKKYIRNRFCSPKEG